MFFGQVAGYWSLMDARDYPAGHGTHVSGSVAGAFEAPQTSSSPAAAVLYNGMAPDARLIFADLQAYISLCLYIYI